MSWNEPCFWDYPMRSGSSHFDWSFPSFVCFLIKMKSPCLMSFRMTCLSFQDFVLAWSLGRFFAAWSHGPSILSTLMMWFSSGLSVVVIAELRCTFSEVKASSPYSSLNGVNFVALDSDVLWHYTTAVSSLTHFSFGTPNNFLDILILCHLLFRRLRWFEGGWWCKV